MKRITLSIITMSLIALIFFSCRPDNKEILQKGIVFYPSDTFGIQKAYEFAGIYLDGDALSIPYKLPPYTLFTYQYFNFSGRIEYNFDGGPVKELPVYKNRSNFIHKYLLCKNGKYLAFGVDTSDLTKRGDKIMWMNKDFTPSYQRFFSDGTRNRWTYGIGEMSNGNFVAINDVVINGNDLQYKMLCIDDSLRTLWQKILPRTPEIQACFTGQKSILVVRSDYADVYSYSGKKLKKFTPGFGHFLESIVAIPDGFLMMGKYLRADKIDVIVIDKYDNDVKLIKSSLIETKNFASDPNLASSIGSNVLETDNSYYFMVNMAKDNVQASSAAGYFSQSFLVKLDKQLQLVFAKPIVDKRFESGQALNYIPTKNFLLQHNNEILNIGQASWNKQIGLSFIRTDFDGNIIN